MTNNEAITLFIAVSTALFTILKTIYERQAAKETARIAALKAIEDAKTAKEMGDREDTNVFTSVSQGLVKTLNEEMSRMRIEQRLLTDRQDRLVKAIYEYLADRAEKLKNNPYCGQCLGADEAFRRQVQMIVINGDTAKTIPN